VLAATNHASDVDPALCRAGRLDRIIQIPYPSSHALAKIYGHYLKDLRSNLSDADMADMGRSSLGLTGADVELVVRTARRVARKDGLRPVAKEDLLRAVFRTPSLENRRAIQPRQLASLAYHEAGHSLAQLLGQSRGEAILYVSVIPRNDGTAGFVASFVGEDTLLIVREDLLERIRTVLAGRAAEEVVFGRDRITSGAGGSDPKCDLAVATRTAQMLLTKYGFAAHGSLVWQASAGDPDPRMMEALHDLLEEQYALVLAQLREHRAMLERLAQSLLEHQELRGDEVRELFRLHAAEVEIRA
jgi:ATP-dependent Zn protease